jgi:hypothetical protein
MLAHKEVVQAFSAVLRTLHGAMCTPLASLSICLLHTLFELDAQMAVVDAGHPEHLARQMKLRFSAWVSVRL